MAFRRSQKPAGRSDSTRTAVSLQPIVKPESGFRVIDFYIPKEVWEKNRGADTVIRAIPPPQLPEEELLYWDAELNDGVIGDWAYQVELLYKVGKGMSTILTSTWVADDGTEVDDDWSVARVCVHKLRTKLEEMILEAEHLGHRRARLMQTGPASWLSYGGYWDKGGRFKSTLHYSLPYPSDHTLLQVLVHKVNGRVMLSADGKPTWKGKHLYVLPNSAEIIDQLLEPAGPGLSVSNNSFGDPVSLANGHPVSIYKKEKAGAARRGRSRGRKTTGLELTYATRLLEKAKPMSEEQASRLWVPWEDIIPVRTIQDVIGDLTRLFSSAAVGYALLDSRYEDFLTDKAKQEGEAVLEMEVNARRPKKTRSDGQRSTGRGNSGQGGRPRRDADNDDFGNDDDDFGNDNDDFENDVDDFENDVDDFGNDNDDFGNDNDDFGNDNGDVDNDVDEPPQRSSRSRGRDRGGRRSDAQDRPPPRERNTQRAVEQLDVPEIEGMDDDVAPPKGEVDVLDVEDSPPAAGGVPKGYGASDPDRVKRLREILKKDK